VTLDDVRRIALGLPEAEEVLTWGTDVTFRVRGKIFAIGGDGSRDLSVKTTPVVQSELIDLDAEIFRRAPYVGRFGWVLVDLERVDPDLLAGLIREAWRATAPKRLAAMLPAPVAGEDR
jgi:hypothetical protein